MKILILSLTILFFSVSTQAETCSIDFYTKFYLLNKDQIIKSKDAIRASDCSEFVQNEIMKEIQSNLGEVNLSNIEKTFGSEKVHITPRKIQISILNDYLHEMLAANSNLYFLDVKSLNAINLIALNENESLNVNCDSCTNIGEKNLKIEILNPFNTSNKATWISSKLMAKTKVFKAKRTLSFQEKSLSENDFYTDEIYTIMPDSLLGSLENINFFKPNKTIIQGAIVSSLDIQPVNLINTGTPVKAILKNSSINLSKTVMATRSARFGEIVELKINASKTISGKVIDFNKVVIEL